MKHSVDFFRDEIRYGFYVPTQVKIAWAASLDVLSEIDRICTKHGITYFADWGTILGAVRHGGFVPWDDDLDICMLRDDYNKFREVADAELPPAYCIHDYERQDDHWLFLSRVVNRKRISFDEADLNDNYNFPWLTGVDIFIKDYLYPDPTDEKARCDEVLHLIAIADGITEGTLNQTSINSNLESIKKKYSINLPSINNRKALSVALYALAEKQMARVRKEDAKEIGQIFPFILKGGKGEPKELYETIVRLPFEDTTIPVPAQYNKVLSRRYGNYNEIRKVWTGHEYPSFEAQKKLFEESANVTLPHFTFDAQMTERPVVDKSGSLKTIAHECMDGLRTLYNDACNSDASSSCEELLQLLGEIQQLAVDLGTLIENVKGETNPHAKEIVAVLEKLCEDVYNCSQSEQPGSAISTISHTLDNLEQALSIHLFNRREILFLPVGNKEWNIMEKIYPQLKTDDDVDITIVPLPLFTKDYYGRPTMNIDDIRSQAGIDKYPENLPIYNWENYDLALHCPEQIYTQFPYDNENTYLTIPQVFFSTNLRNFTEDLVYVPIGRTSEFTEKDITDQSCLRFYVTAPAVVYADRVLVQSENIKNQYVNALTQFAGATTQNLWEDKIQPDESIFSAQKHPNDRQSIEKRLLYCISLYELTEHAQELEAAITKRLDALSSSGDKLSFSMCFYPQTFTCSDSKLLESVNSLRQTITQSAKERGVETIPLPDDLSDLASHYDAYYGSSCPLVHLFTEQNKPVMISNYNM